MRMRAVLLCALLLASVVFADALEQAKVGQWVLYKMANDMRMKQSVVKVEGKRVTIRNEMWIKGQPLPANETPIDTDKKPDSADKPAKTETTKDTLTINNHKLDCRVQTQGNVKTWLSDDVPITGIVRQELDGKPTMELVGYGASPDEDRLK